MSKMERKLKGSLASCSDDTLNPILYHAGHDRHGSLFGATLDTYNRFLNRNARKRWLVFLNDVLFWILQALFIFYILFSVNFGEVRFYIFIALLCGFAGYQALLKASVLRPVGKDHPCCISFIDFIVKMVTESGLLSGQMAGRCC